ncbi:MAG: hypothetical protein KIT45_06880 [Fimbriimonadia bacterium]|nr:hypothetical protein [Fimbriimonadia bacterium]
MCRQNGAITSAETLNSSKSRDLWSYLISLERLEQLAERLLEAESWQELLNDG